MADEVKGRIIHDCGPCPLKVVCSNVTELLTVVPVC